MFKYHDGSDVLVRDNVLIENGKTPGVVDLLIPTEEEAKIKGKWERKNCNNSTL
jgi:hypothetical protein